METVWKSEITSNLIPNYEEIGGGELADLVNDLNKAVQAVCEEWGIK